MFMDNIVKVGAGDITTQLPAGQTGLTDSKNNKPIDPALTDDFQGAPPTNSVFTPLAYHQWDNFSSGWMNADPMAFRTEAQGLAVGYTPTPTVKSDGYSYDSYESLTLGLAGLNASGTKLAGQSDWSATADWDGKMRATMVQGGLFTYVTRQSTDDVVIDLHEQPRTARDTPVDPLSYSMAGLTGAFDGGALAFNVPVDAGSSVADGLQFRVSYDFDGDGKVDRTETYDWYATDAGIGYENYSTSKLIASTGKAMADLKDGSVKVELWRANGSGDLTVQTNSASSYVKVPFSGLTTKDGGTLGSTLYFQQGATAGGPASTLAGAPGSTVASDTTYVTPLPSIGGYSGPGQVWYQQDGVVGITVNGVSYGVFGPPGSTWTYTDAGLRSNLGGQDFYSVAVLPDNSVATLQEFRQHAYAFVTGTQMSYSIDKATNTLVTTYTLTTDMKATGADLSSDPLTALYGHQTKFSDAATEAFSYHSARGDMKGFAGSTFSTDMQLAPIMPIMPFLGSDTQKAELQGLIHDQLKDFLSRDKNPMANDTYWGSRQIAKYTDLALLAQQVDYGQARDVFLGAAEKQLSTWFTASDGDAWEFYYDDKWKELLGYPGSYNQEDKSNDMSLQFGYMINAAATVAMLDPEWAKQSNYGAMVNMVIANVNNWRRDDPSFAYLRGFDPYTGHNWASGTGSGITQESATESLNFDAAVARWGAATGQTDIENLGLYLYTTESEAFMEYYLNVDNDVFPDGFDKSRIGVLGANGGSYTTYFGTDPNYVQGINETPILPQSSLFMGFSPQEIEQDFAYLRSETSDRSTEWMNSTQMYLAMANPEAALADYRANPQYKDGGGEESRPYTLEFIESLVAMGTIDAKTRANSPYASVYIKNGVKSYVAWNPAATSMTITFSDGVKLTVAPGDMVTRTADGVLHTVDFQQKEITARPPGIPLDLPTDPPEYKLTTVVKNGDLTLSVEDVTGTAWMTVGAAAPRAMVGNAGVRLKVQLSPTDRLVAVGRDATGQVHLLMSGNATGGEPYYDKKLTANYGIADNGPALYNADYAKLEPLYGRDFNGDGVIVGGETKVVAQNGQLQLFVDAGDGRAYVKDGANPMTEIRRDAGGAATLLTRGGSSLSAVGKDADGNIRVLDVVAGGGVAYAWKLDAKGVWTSETVYSLSDPVATAGAEAIFQQDLNGDGVIPAALPQVVAKNGSLQLLVDAQGKALIQLEDGTRISVMRGDQPVQLDRGSQLSAVGRDGEGNLRVLDGNPGDFGPNATHWSWKLDAKGNWIGEDTYAGAEISKAEGIYGRDFDGDGTVSGSQKQLIAANGDDALFVDQATGKAYASVHGASPIALTRDGWGDVQAQRGDWGLLAIASDDQGRTRVLDANPFDDMKYAWILDANGHWSGEQSFDKAHNGAAELLFSADLNHDGVIGDRVATSIGTSGGRSASLVRSY
jgi:hypothetical protein